MIDIHSHIIPLLDDGSDSEECTLKMAKIAVENKIKRMIVTPHVSYRFEGINKDVILKSLEKTEKLIKTNNINLSLYPGSEVLLSDEIPGLLKKGNIVTLNNSRYIMIEFRMGSIPLYAEEILFEIKLNGYTPIIAHPERNLEILKNPDIIERLIGTGCLLQINSGSLIGDFKRSNKKMALYLLKKSKVTFIGTDAHSYRMRKPTMYKAFFMIYKKFGLEMAKNLFYRNPYKILYNKEI